MKGSLTEKIAGKAEEALAEAGRMIIMAGKTIVWTFLPPFRFRLVLQQMESIGVGSLPIVLLTALSSGMVMALQGQYAFSLFNAESMVGASVAIVLTREMAPVLTALMVTGRSCSAIATELGTMRVTEQLDALETMAVNPIHYLVVPRILASMVMVPVLTMICMVVGIAGAYFIGVHLLGINAGTFISKIQWFVDPDDIAQGLIKSFIFGIVITFLGCYKGFTAEGGAKGVGKATTSAVVLGSVAVLILDYFLTAILFSPGGGTP